MHHIVLAITMPWPLWAEPQELSLAALGSDAFKTVLEARLSDSVLSAHVLSALHALFTYYMC